MATDVRLVDLEVFKRFSLAVRQEYAPADELLAALDESRAAVSRLIGTGSSRRRPAAPPGRASGRRR